MAQNIVDFTGDPSGDQLLDDLLTDQAQNFLTLHSGSTRPSYAQAGTMWLDTTTNPWLLKVFDNTDDITLGSINTTTNAFTPTNAGTIAAGQVTFANLAADVFTSRDWTGFNFLYNPDMAAYQRSSNFTISSTSAFYVADRWAVVQGAGTVSLTAARNASALTGIRYAQRITRNSANTNTNTVSLAQPLETQDSIPLDGKKVVLSFYARAGAALTVGALVGTGTGTDQSLSTFIGGSWTGYSANTGQNNSVTTSWQRFTYVLTLPSSITQAGVRFNWAWGGTWASTDWLEITGVKLEVISANETGATAFVCPKFAEELARLQRYYEKSFSYGTAPAQNAGTTGAVYLAQSAGASTSQACGYVALKQTKRTSPTITFYNPSAANAQLRGVSADWTATAAALTGDAGFGISGTSPAATAAGNPAQVHYSADAEL